MMLVALAPGAAFAQDTANDSAYLTQTEANDATSKVYFPDAITPEAVEEARARAAQQDQLSSEKPERQADRATQQISSGERNGSVEQLVDGSTVAALAQLSDAERKVLLEAIEGTDICESPPPIEAIRELCRNRIENRSEDFAQDSRPTLSAEERLLGESLADITRPGLDRIIERLARNVGKADNPENQAIASVALTSSALSPGETGQTSDEPGSELSPETQTLINALIQQLTNPGGGS